MRYQSDLTWKKLQNEKKTTILCKSSDVKEKSALLITSSVYVEKKYALACRFSKVEIEHEIVFIIK